MIPNIGPRGQERRLRFGLIALGAAFILAMALLMLGVPRGWRVVVFVPLWIGALGVFQARAKT
jgi:hypothetical protein